MVFQTHHRSHLLSVCCGFLSLHQRTWLWSDFIYKNRFKKKTIHQLVFIYVLGSLRSFSISLIRFVAYVPSIFGILRSINIKLTSSPASRCLLKRLMASYPSLPNSFLRFLKSSCLMPEKLIITEELSSMHKTIWFAGYV